MQTEIEVVTAEHSTMNIDAQWFKERLAERQMSQRQLAKKLGIDQSAISLTLAGKRRMQFKEAAEIARLIGSPVSEVLRHAGVPVEEGQQTVPFTGFLDGTGEIHCFEPEGLDRIRTPHPMPEGSAVIQCRTSDSALSFMDGWLLFRNPPNEVPVLDQFSVIRIKNGIRTAGIVRRGYRTGRWNITGPAFQATDVELEWSAPITAIKTS